MDISVHRVHIIINCNIMNRDICSSNFNKYFLACLYVRCYLICKRFRISSDIRHCPQPYKGNNDKPGYSPSCKKEQFLPDRNICKRYQIKHTSENFWNIHFYPLKNLILNIKALYPFISSITSAFLNNFFSITQIERFNFILNCHSGRFPSYYLRR